MNKRWERLSKALQALDLDVVKESRGKEDERKQTALRELALMTYEIFSKSR